MFKHLPILLLSLALSVSCGKSSKRNLNNRGTQDPAPQGETPFVLKDMIKAQATDINKKLVEFIALLNTPPPAGSPPPTLTEADLKLLDEALTDLSLLNLPVTAYNQLKSIAFSTNSTEIIFPAPLKQARLGQIKVWLVKQDSSNQTTWYFPFGQVKSVSTVPLTHKLIFPPATIQYPVTTTNLSSQTPSMVSRYADNDQLQTSLESLQMLVGDREYAGKIKEWRASLEVFTIKPENVVAWEDFQKKIGTLQLDVAPTISKPTTVDVLTVQRWHYLFNKYYSELP